MIATRSHLQQPQATSKYFMQAAQQPGGPSPPETYDFASAAGQPPRTGSSTSINQSPTQRFDALPYDQQQQRIRQIYPPKTAMYVPAALRPTEHHTRPTNIPSRPAAPDTPPASKGNSFDDGKTAKFPNRYYHTNHTPTDIDFEALTDQLINYDPPDSTLLEVTGQPATSHWKPDETSPCCVICQATFTWYFRRHHCRKCGYVVCGEHSMKQVALDQNAHFHPKGHMSRACDGCYVEFKQWKKARGDGGSMSEDGSVPATPSLQVPGSYPATLAPPQQTGAGAEPRSLGLYANWSTF